MSKIGAYLLLIPAFLLGYSEVLIFRQNNMNFSAAIIFGSLLVICFAFYSRANKSGFSAAAVQVFKAAIPCLILIFVIAHGLGTLS